MERILLEKKYWQLHDGAVSKHALRVSSSVTQYCSAHVLLMDRANHD